MPGILSLSIPEPITYNEIREALTFAKSSRHMKYTSNVAFRKSREKVRAIFPSKEKTKTKSVTKGRKKGCHTTEIIVS